MEYKIGDVLRPKENWTFGYSLIVKVNDNGTYKLARPYAYVSDFTGAVFLSYEVIDQMSENSLDLHWVRTERGRTIR